MSTRPRPLTSLVTALAVLALAVLGLTQPVIAVADSRPTRYIVSTWSADGAAQTVSELSRSGVRTRHRFDRVFAGFAVDLSGRQVAALRGNPRVRAVVPDRVLRISSTQTRATWGLDRIDQRRARDGSYSYLTSGAGVRVFSIDTGVRVRHGEFGGRARNGWDFVDGDSVAQDCNGHGTHVAATIAGRTHGVAKGSDLVALRVLDCEGAGWESDFISALQWVLEHHPSGPSVVNISAGGDPSPEMDAAVQSVVAAGVSVVVAAGNEDQDACDVSPARAANAITVGATEKSDRRAGYSNFGSCVDLFAPGSQITSAGIASDTATQVLSGTSMATPHVTGAVARYLQAYPGASPAAVRTALIGDSTTGAVTNLAGSANRLLFVRVKVAGAPPRSTAKHSDSAHTATLSWGAAFGFGAPSVTGYRVTRSGPGGTSSTNLPAGARSYVFTGLTPGKKYVLAVRARCSAQVGPMSSRAVTMLSRPGRGRVQAPVAGSTRDDTSSITTRWQPPASGGSVASYRLEARRVSSAQTVRSTAAGSARSRQLSRLSKDAAYEVRVRAVNAAGPGAWSAWSARVKAR